MDHNDQGHWRLQPSLTIGSADGEKSNVFGRIAALEVDDAGAIYVVDGFDRELRVFGPDGAFIRRFGRRGGGPGEFESVIGMSIAADSTLWIVDGQNARYTTLHGDKFQTRRRGSPQYSVPWLGGAGLDGKLYDAVVLPGQTNEVLLRVALAGAATDTLPLSLPQVQAPRRRGLTFPLPYAPRVLTAFDRRGFVWTGTTHEYRLTKTSVQGGLILTVRRDLKPRPLSSAESDSIRRYVRQLEPMRIVVRDDMIPQTGPLLHALAVDDLGRLWVARGLPGEGWTFDVFDDSGRQIAEVASSFKGTLVRPVIRADNVYAALESEDGVPIVVRARIVRR